MYGLDRKVVVGLPARHHHLREVCGAKMFNPTLLCCFASVYNTHTPLKNKNMQQILRSNLHLHSCHIPGRV